MTEHSKGESERDHFQRKCLSDPSDWKRFEDGRYVYPMVEIAWQAWQSRAALSAVCADSGKESAGDAMTLLAAIIDIYDDGMNNAPEDRCYVEGAWREVLDEARTFIAKEKK